MSVAHGWALFTRDGDLLAEAVRRQREGHRVCRSNLRAPTARDARTVHSPLTVGVHGKVIGVDGGNRADMHY